MARAGAQVTAIDLAEKSISVTKRRLKLKGLEGEVLRADAENLPFKDETFDYVWSWGVIHHSPDTKACAKEISRVLKTGGRMDIMLYHRNSLYNWLNVIFRYGILRGKLAKMSIQELHNRYTDGKEQSGAPLSKYYTREQIKRDLFPNFEFEDQVSFEQKKALSFFVPAAMRRGFEDMIPDEIYTWLWSYLGFLCFSSGKKVGPHKAE